MTITLESPGACAPTLILPLSASDIVARIEDCQSLPAMSTTSAALRERLHGDNQNISQIAELIRRDPSLTSRLLRLVNTVQFGLTNPLASIDQAVLYLGTQQVRQLVLIEPYIDDHNPALDGHGFGWKPFWRHCIGTAILTHELCLFAEVPRDDMPYMAGLLHDIGKVVMACVFPEHFREVRRRIDAGEIDLPRVEREVLGTDHMDLGGHYLARHRLFAPLAAAARFHHSPLGRGKNEITAAVQLADFLMRQAGVGVSGNPVRPPEKAGGPSCAWKALLPRANNVEISALRRSLEPTMAELPLLLEGLV